MQTSQHHLNLTISRVLHEAPDGLPLPALLDVAERPGVCRTHGAGPPRGVADAALGGRGRP
eukprot:2702950-Pyramimonas_sp.AAC.1